MFKFMKTAGLALLFVAARTLAADVSQYASDSSSTVNRASFFEEDFTFLSGTHTCCDRMGKGAVIGRRSCPARGIGFSFCWPFAAGGSGCDILAAHAGGRCSSAGAGSCSDFAAEHRFLSWIFGVCGWRQSSATRQRMRQHA